MERPEIQNGIRRKISLGYKTLLVFSLFVFIFSNVELQAQCTVTGVSGSGFLFAQQCAPVTTGIYYEFTFFSKPPLSTYRVLYFWGDGTSSNSFPAVQWKSFVPGDTTWYVRAELTHSFPADGDCEYEVQMALVDDGFICSDSRQFQVVGNWHQDDEAAAFGSVALTPLQEDVCEGLPLYDHQFTDATNFACNLQDNALLQKPNHQPRYQQYVYGTNPIAGRGIPNLYIKVGTAQTIVYLTDVDGDPVANSWTVDPITGGPTGAYSTASGYFEGPKELVPVDGGTGAYSLNDTYPISFDGVGTVFQDQFEVTVRNWNVCNPVTPNEGTAIIYIIDGPLADAGADDSVCEGSAYSLNGAVEDATSSLWTTSGTGSFGNAASPTTTYIPSAADASSGTVDLTLHAYAGGLCPEHTDVMTLTIEPLPTKPVIVRSAGDDDATFCDDNGTTFISIRTLLPSPSGIYRWKKDNVLVPGLTTQLITLDDWTESGDYTATVYGNTANNCPIESDPFTVTIGRPVTVNITTANGTICSNSTFAISANTIGPVTSRLWTTSGNGSFAPDNNNNTVYTPGPGDAGNTVTLTYTVGTAAPCGPDFDQVTLTVVPQPTAYAGSDAMICQGEQYNVADATASEYSSVSWSHNGAGSLSFGATLAPRYNSVAADAGNTVTLTLRANGNAPCAFTTDQMQILVDHTPTATTNVSQTVCETAGGANLQGNSGGSDLANGAIGFWTFPTIWKEDFNDLADGTINDAGPTAWSRTMNATDWAEVRNYRFELRDADNWVVWTSEVINISAFTDVGLSADLIASGNMETDQDSIMLFYKLDSGAETLWENKGTVKGSFGTETATHTGLNGSTVQIVIRARNTADNEFYYWDNITVIEGGAPIIADPTNPTSAVTNLPVGSTVFTWTVSSANGACTPATATHTVTVEPELLPGAISGDQSICLGDNPPAFTSDVAASGGAAPITYQWYHRLNAGGWGSVGGNVEEYDPPATLVAGLHEYYRVAISASGVCGPVQTGLVEIIVNPGPTDQIHSITGDASGCEDETITLNYSAVTNATEYVWNVSWLGADVDFITTTPTIDIDLSAYPFASPSELVTVSAAGRNGCNLDATPGTGDYPWSLPWNITVYQNPIAAAGDDDEVCGSLAIILAAVPTVGTGTWTDMGTGPGTVSFSNGSLATAVATATRYGTYTLQWEEDNGGCVSTDNVSVTFDEQPTVTAPADFGVCDALSTTLNGTGHSYQAGSDHSETYIWEYVSGPDASPVFGTSTSIGTTVTVDYFGTYQFRITETNGTCTDSDIVQVVFSEEPSAAAAGTDINVACDALSVNLAGTAHTYLGGSNVDASSRTWTFESGPNAAVVFTDATNPSTLVTVPEYGNYEFRWTETNGTCTVTDVVLVKFFEDPDGLAGSGPYTADCDLKIDNITVTAHTYAGVAANHPESTRGWSYFSGPDNSPVFSNPTGPNTNVTVDNYGTYVFRWTETNGTCSNHVDVTVTYNENPSLASAGLDLTALCDNKSINLSGTAHGYEAAPSTHTGSTRGWTWISGPGVAGDVSFTSPTSPTSEVVVTYFGTYVFEWTEINGNCTVSDQVSVNFYEDPDGASAGGNITATCNSYTATLDGTGHTYDLAPNDHSTSTSLWTYVSGPGVAGDVSFVDATDPKTDVTVTYYGTYVFEWTETNGNCTRSDQVTVYFNENPVDASAGSDVTGACGSLTEALGGTAHVYDGGLNDSSGATRTWAYVSGPDAFPIFADATDPATDVTVTQYGAYEFSWTETNGNCSVSETINVTLYEAPTVSVDPVANVCRDSTLLAIPISGDFGGGASTAAWTITTGNGSFQNINIVGTTVSAEYVPTYDDITAGSVTLTLTTNDPTGPCLPVPANLIINIDEAVYVVINEAPSVFIAEGTFADLTATISGGGVTQGIWTELGALTGGTFATNNQDLTLRFTPTAAQEAAGGVTLRLTSFDPGTACGPTSAEVQIIIGANPIADAGSDIEDCEPADSLIYLSGYAKASANDANWSVITGNGVLTPGAKIWSAPQSVPHDENDSLLVEAIYKLAPSDYGTPSTGSVFQFSLTTDDPDGAGPVSDDTDDLNYTVHWSPNTPSIGGGGLSSMCVDTYGQFYSVPLTPGNDYEWNLEVLTGGGVAGTDYTIVGGGTGFNFIAIDWFTEGTYNLKLIETTYLSDGTTPCVGEEVVLPIAVYKEPVVTAGSDATICLGETHLMNSNVTDGSGTYLYEWTPTTGLSSPNVPNPTITGLFTGTFDYYLKVTDLISGCESVSGMVTITIDPLPVQYNLTGPAYYCFGAATGVNLTLSDSEADVYYQLMNGAVPVGAAVLGDGNPIVWTDNFDGSYYVEAVRDAIPACSQTMAGVVNVTANPAITMSEDLVLDVECFGSNEGAIQISAGGGTSPYTFLWSGPGVYSSTNEDITGLYAGDYTVTITDARGCQLVSAPITVSQPVQLAITSVLETQAVTCFGGNDGEAEVVVDAATGTAPYNFQWYYDVSLSSPVIGATTSTLIGVPAATYYVLVTDANMCTVSGSVLVTQPAEITGSGAQTAVVSCNGASDAEITITAAGGSGTLEYDLNGADTWQGSNIFNGLGAGTYTLRVRDQFAPVCVVNLNDVVISEPDVLSAVISSTYVTCFGANDGNITFNSSLGGYGTYEYSVDGGTIWQGTPIFNGLAPGFYDLRIRDAAFAACEITLDANYEITEPAVLFANIASTDVTCFGSNDGTITLSGASGGYGTYEYSINAGLSWQSSASYTGLAPGLYDIRIRDAVNTGCVIVLDGAYGITQPAVLNADLASTDVTCNGANDGTITLTNPAGGYGTYEYSINGGLTWQVSGNFAALSPGFYNVRIRDAANTGCEITLNALLQITEPSVLTATVAGSDITCNGAGDGEINITNPNGGYGTYDYTIDGGTTWQGTGAFVGLIPGFYDVRIRDAAFTACEIILDASLELTEPAVLDATITSADITCNGANDGIITFSNPTGGYGTYQFTVDGGTTWGSSGSFTGLTPGLYDVRIRDAANTGCEITLDAALAINEPVVLAADLATTDISCYGSADGTINITNPTGGYGTYEYSINGGGSWQASGSFATLAPGSYNIRIRDAAFTGCVITLDPALVITQPAILNATVTPTNVSCNGANDGIINITAPSGGYGTYDYTIDGGTTWQGTGNFMALLPGTYDVRIRDAVNTGCEVVLNSSLQITEPAVLSAVITSSDITCFAANNGSIIFNAVSGGYGTYEFTIDGGTTWQGSPTFSGLIPGFYDLRIRDAAHTGCEIILDANYEITEPAVLFANVASTNVTCFGSNNGTITLSGATGGYGTYAYSINGGVTWQSSANFTGLAPGTYDVRIRDAAFTACEITIDGALEITEPAMLTAILSSTDITCNGADDGTITISAPGGGYGTYDYSIDGGVTWQVSGNFTALTPGFYNVRIRDAANTGCELTLNSLLRISEPGELAATISSSNITCNGANDGVIILSNPIGGYGTYEYTIDGGTTWQAGLTFNGLTPGFYDVRIRDAVFTACEITLNAALEITEPDLITATVTPGDITCNAANDGTIFITGPTGGYGTYQYTIDGGTSWSGSGNFTNLIPGFYDVRIRDAAFTACEIILDAALEITEPPVLDADLATTNISCYGSADGVIDITNPTGGYGTYEYSINGGGLWQASGNYTGLVPGSYNVRIRDAAFAGCVITLDPALVITQPAILNATVTPTNVSCNGANDGIIDITAPSGGYGTYEYTIDGGTSWQGTGNFTALIPGSYDVRIRDAANTGCEIVLNPALQITEPAVLSAVISSTDITCNGADDGTITINSPTGGYGTYEYTIDGGTTWQFLVNFTALIPGLYDVRIRDAAHTGCEIILDAAYAITEPAVLFANVASTDVTCFGSNNGTITLSGATGGYGTYAYSINGGTSWQSSANFTGLAPGTYDVRIRDAAFIACEITLDGALEITQPAILSATVNSTNITCNGADDGTITISAPSGGYGTYDYSVDGGVTWQASGNFTALTPGFYNVRIRDAAFPGCEITLDPFLGISEPSALNAALNSTNITCNGANDGTITLSNPIGGYGTYEYTIDGGTTWQSGLTFSGLIPGFYDVRIRDAAFAACEITLDAALEITEPAAITATVTSTDLTCNLANDGTISISGPSGGYGIYQYTIDGGTSWSGSGNFTNLTPGFYDVRIRDAAYTGCEIVLDAALEITEPAILDADLATTDITCYGAADGVIDITNPSGGYGTYEYSINGGGSWQVSGNFTGLVPGGYNVKIRDAAFTGCVITLDPALIITQPAQLFATVTPTNVSCNGANDGIIDITAPSGGYGTYDYSIDGGATWQISGNFTNLAPATYDVRIRDAANVGCEIVLNPVLQITEPTGLVLTPSADINLACYGDMTGTGTFIATGGTMNYTFSEVTNTTGSPAGITTFNSISYFGAGAGIITVRVDDANGCFDEVTINFNEPAQLTAGEVGINQVVCFGDDPAQLNETVAATGGWGGYVYQWQIAPDTLGPYSNIPAATDTFYDPSGASSTSWYRREVRSGICTPEYTPAIQIFVNPLPVAMLSGGATICAGESTNLTVTMFSGTGPYTVEIENHGTVNNYTSGTPIPVSPAVPGSTVVYKILSVTDFNGCTVSDPSGNLNGTATVRVRELPAISVDPVPVQLCEYNLAQFEVTATGDDLTYQWQELADTAGSVWTDLSDVGGYFGSNQPTLMLFSATRDMNDYSYRAVVSTCGTDAISALATLTVDTPPEFISQPEDSTICFGEDGTFEIQAQGTGLTYQWFVNTGTGFNPVVDGVNYSGATTSTLSIIDAPLAFDNDMFRIVVTGTCGVPIYSSFAILHVIQPPAPMLHPVDVALCDGLGTYLSANGSLYLTTKWQVDNGGGWADISDDGITYVGSDSPILSILTTDTGMDQYEYRMAFFGECDTAYTNPAVLTVHSNPVVDFTGVDPLFACGGIDLQMNGNPAGGSGTYTTHRWTGQVGPLSNFGIVDPVFNTTIQGNYNMTYTVTDDNTCVGSGSVTVNVEKPDAQFMIDQNMGCPPLEVNFTDASLTPAGTTYTWDFGDGTPVDITAGNTSHTYVNATTSLLYYDVTLEITSPNGCVDQFVQGVTVWPSITADFEMSADTICSGEYVVFNTDPGAALYEWTFDDGSPTVPASNVTNHLFTNNTGLPVTHNIELITTSYYGCKDTIEYPLVVYPMPVPTFLDPPDQVYPNATVTFTNTTSTPGTWDYRWTFGDGNGSTANSPTHTYTDPGYYEVWLFANNTQCIDSTFHMFNLMPTPPVPDFDSIPGACAPHTVTMTNNSLYADSYVWEFGDGGVSYAENPTYTYLESGTYRITLTVTGPGGVRSTSKLIEVWLTPRAYFQVAPELVYVDDEKVRCFNLSEGADSYIWEFGDGDTAMIADPFHKYMAEGVYDITLHAYSSNGCYDTYTLSPAVTVQPAGDIRFANVFRPNRTGEIDPDVTNLNSDQIDLLFFPPVKEQVSEYKLQIFNRSGVLIYQSDEITKGWNGYYKGKLCMQGVYVWYVEGKYANGKPFKKVGDITLLH